MQRTRITWLVLLAVFLLLPPSSLALAKDKFIALRGATLIDGTGSDPISNSLIIIRNDRIIAVGTVGDFEIPARAKIIDLQGYTVLPGFINSHVHGTLNLRYLEIWAFEGVTTVRDLGANLDSLLEFRKNEFKPKHARLVAAGPMISVPGGYPIVPFDAGYLTMTVTSAADAREKVEKILDKGVDIVKIALESRMVEGLPVMTLEEAGMIVRTAHGRGTLVSAHAMSKVDLEKAVDAGADDVAHMVVDRAVPGSLLRTMIEKNIYWVPTLELLQVVGITNELTTAMANLEAFVNAGGQVALGTDFFGYAGTWDIGMPMIEIGLMRQAGMSAMQIIVAATKNAAKVCNLERDLGTIEKGKIADLIVVKGDPLADVSLLGNGLEMVMHNGSIIRDELSSDGSPVHGRQHDETARRIRTLRRP